MASWQSHSSSARRVLRPNSRRRGRRALHCIALLLLPLAGAGCGHADAPAAAGSAIPKISHYGNYGTLVFSNGSNRHKARVPQQPDGDRVIFANEEQP